jgi:GNAT superfamily N-acetyltransferase
MPVQVRPAEPGDVDALVASSAALFAEDAGSHDPTADVEWPYNEGRSLIAAGITDPRRLALIGVDGGAVVGHLTGVLEDPSVLHMIPIAELRSMYVRPQYRDSGLGSELVQRFLAWARDHGAQRVSVTAYAGNIAAMRFYQRQGFTPHEVVLIAPVEQ